MNSGYLSIILHAHLPYVRHPEHDNFLEEHWLFEAITETYIPLLRVFEQLEKESVSYNVLLSLSPTLVTMLDDELLQERFLRRAYRILALCDKEIDRNKNNSELLNISKWYHNFFLETIDWFENKCNCRLIQKLAEISSHGNLDLMTCGATHGFLPLIKNDAGAVNAQLQVAYDFHANTFGAPASGIWLPECAYYPGLDENIKKAGFKYFILDTHGIENAANASKRGIYAPIYCPSGVAAFARDPESSKQVWSAEEGYPGANEYREFYRDIGHELDNEYLGNVLIDGKIKSDTGLKYYAITGNENKSIYNPNSAREKVALDAGDFLSKRQQQIEYLCTQLDRKPLIVSPYDAELFGHWWFEGPMFLDILLRKIHYDQTTIKTITPEKYLAEYPENIETTPNPSSWGGEGYFEFWCSDCNNWIFPLLNTASHEFSQLLKKYPEENISPIQKRILCQSARELLLAQASDWPFIIRTNTSPEYASNRVKSHLARLQKLNKMLESNNIDENELAAIEYTDKIFPNITPYHLI